MNQISSQGTMQSNRYNDWSKPGCGSLLMCWLTSSYPSDDDCRATMMEQSGAEVMRLWQSKTGKSILEVLELAKCEKRSWGDCLGVCEGKVSVVTLCRAFVFCQKVHERRNVRVTGEFGGFNCF